MRSVSSSRVPEPATGTFGGDGLHTDIVGANGMGFDCIFIAGGIHAIELKILEGNDPEPEALAGLFHGHTHPKGVMPRLFW